MDNIEALLEKLQELGIKVDEIEAYVRDRISFGLPSFKVAYSKWFDQELMRYQIYISKINDQYNLAGLTATHRDPVDIEELSIAGVNTTSLDKDMKAVDWDVHFRQTVASINTDLAGNIISRIKAISDLKDSDGLNVQQLLMYKHWPEHIYESYRIEGHPDLKKFHEHSYTFSARLGESLNVNLAHMVISERYDHLWNLLGDLGLERIAGLDIDELLKKHLKDNPDSFIITSSFNTPKGFTEFSIPVSKIDGWYLLDTYNVNLTPYPQMHHGIYNGLDTAELEKQIQSVDWKNDDELFIFHDDDMPEFLPVINSIQEQLYQLSKDIAGGYIGAVLQLQYMQEATFFDGAIDQDVWDLLDRLPKLEREFPAEINIDAAVNLLYGSAVFNYIGIDGAENVRDWIRLDLQDREHGYPPIPISSYSKPELEKLVGTIAGINFGYGEWCQNLMNGDQVKLRLNQGQTILVSAHPEQKTLNLFTTDHKPIPFNFNFDPDWSPGKSAVIYTRSNQQQIQKKAPRIRLANKYKKGKGKGL